MPITPNTYAQFGEDAGDIMWNMHRRITELERDRDALMSLLVEAADKIESLTNLQGSRCGRDLNMDLVNRIRKQQLDPTPAQRIADGIDAIQRGVNDMDRLGVDAQALSDVDQCLAWIRSAFDELPENIVTHEKTLCNACRYYVRDEQRLDVGDGTYTETSAWCDVPTATDCPAARACGFGNEGK